MFGHGHPHGHGHGQPPPPPGPQYGGGGYPPVPEPQHEQTFKIFCRADEGYCLTVRHDAVVLAPTNPRDEYQYWYKDMRLSTRVKDEEGHPAFALVNRATGLAIKHSLGQSHPVKLVPYNPEYEDPSVLWTESRDVGHGFRCIRMVNNIYLNFDAFHGDKDHGGVHDGTEIVLWKWCEGDNQRWKILPWGDAVNNIHRALALEPTVRVFCGDKPKDSLTVRNGTVCLAPTNPTDNFQHWVKDMRHRHSTIIMDKEGHRAFALVNKTTGKAIKHSIGERHPVRLVPYNPDNLDKSVLWTSKDYGVYDRFICIRMFNNIKLNWCMGKNHGGVHDGTPVVLRKLPDAVNKNQLWMIVPS